MQIQVRINEEGTLRNQRYAFTDRFTLVSELLQNARRAGARQVEIHHDAAAQVLHVQDDGAGIDDFQTLLSFSESGWTAAACEEERPFGVGFFKCLYAATCCIVTSGARRVVIDTAAALRRMPIDVLPIGPDEVHPGTTVELHGVDLPEMDSRMETLCLGFPITVVFNGKPLGRRLAAGNLSTLPSPIGAVHLTGTRDGRYSHQSLVFLQGFCVLRPSYGSLEEVNVVHLDPGQFVARLPDRDKLIDEDVQRARIDAALRACWLQTLEAARSQLPASHFVDVFYAAMSGWQHLALLNDIDVLPPQLCRAILAYPTHDDGLAPGHLQPAEGCFTRDAVEAGTVTLTSLRRLAPGNTAHWMLARAKRYVVLDWLGLQRSHWVQPCVRFLEGEPVTVEPVGEQLRTVLEGRRIRAPLVLCEAVRIRIGDDEVEIGDEGVHHQGTLYIPAQETTGKVVHQAVSYLDDHERLMGSDLAADREALADLIRRLRLRDPVQLLDSLLREVPPGAYPRLQGRCFRVTVGRGAAPGYAIDLID